MTELVRERLKSVPNRPGCYLMRDRRGDIIYVGKAKNLRRRVLSYFRPGAQHPPKVRSMVNTVWDLEWMTVKNDAEALLTEASLIKRHKPHFNILMRDDKRYLALRADADSAWPRFTCVRIVRDDGARYFGPFPSAPVVRAAKDFVEKRWGIRGCKAVVPDGECHRHCLADVIRTCSAPCLGRISEAEYRANFEEACAFLEGKRPAVVADVVERMKAAAAKGDYETAARLRDTVGALREMTKQHFTRKTPEMHRADAARGLAELAEAIGLKTPPRIIECADISNLFGTHNVASLVVARDGLPDGRYYRHFKIASFSGADDPRAMAEVVRRRYGPDSTLLETSPRADLFVCDGGITQLRAARAVFAELGITDIPTIGLAERQEEIVLDPETIPRGQFQISNCKLQTFGSDTQASNFKLQTFGSDTQASNCKLQTFGSDTQASNFKLQTFGSDTQASDFKLPAFGSDTQAPSILLPRDSQALFVLTRLRDEAHRFAITYHRNLREKAIRESVLDEIPGIGEAKKMKLLAHFRSVYAIARADESEIASVAGVTAVVAGEIHRRLSAFVSQQDDRRV